jgi:two-component system, CAI-1 autoinducer sensor kinase/phosphatase CqsS
MNISEALSYLSNAAEKSAEYSERNLRFLSTLVAFVPLAYVVDYYVGRPYFDTLLIRTAAFIPAVPGIIYASTKLRSIPKFHLYFVGSVTYILPFTFGLMLVLNAASAPQGQHIEMLWILQYFIALFLFIQIIHNGYLATILWLLSTVAALASLALLGEVNWEEINRVILYPVTGYLTALFVGIVTNRNVDYVNSEKLKAASAVGANLAHELRTPLASIRSLARAVNKYSKILVETYDAAKKKGIHTGELNQGQIEGLSLALDSILEEVNYSNTVIDMLLLNTSDRSRFPQDPSVFSLSDCVRESIARYPFNNSSERALLSLEIVEDFRASGSRLLIVHVLFNLLKNAVYYAQKKRGGTAKIVVGPNARMIEVTDTGPGIASGIQNQIFDRFFTTTDMGQGAGIGLSFCKMVMESIGGEIQCESREGEFTTFRLIFPPVEKAREESVGGARQQNV